MTINANVSGREALADFIETTLLTRGTTPLGLDALFALVEEETGNSITQISHSLGAMSARATTLGNAYPFESNAVMVRARPGAPTTSYAALLLLSSNSVARQLFFPTTTGAMEVEFENLAAAALAQLWGSQGRALRFGWPSDNGRPQDFPSAVAWLARTIGVKVGAGYRQPRRKDGGVDVVAWRPFPDQRSGFPLMLAQCTLQSDLISKSADIDVRLWASWLALDVEPVTALVIPGILRTDVIWNEIALRCMIFDRVRLAGLLDGQLPATSTNWVESTLARLGEVLAGALATTPRKADLVVEIARAIGMPAPPMSTGSSEPRILFDQINEVLGLGLEGRRSKPALARGIVEASGQSWRAGFESQGDTVTQEGLTAVLRAIRFFQRGA